MKSISPSIISLPWRQNATEFWFSNLSDKPWSMLLHSGYVSSSYGRFDIIVSDPFVWFETYGTSTKKSNKKNSFSQKKDPLSILEDELKSIKFRPEYNPDLPFQGGAVGLFGYDLCRFFERIPEHSENDISLPIMAIGFYDWTLIIDHQKKRVSLLSYKDPYERLSWINSQHTKEKTSPFFLTSEWKSNMTFQQYRDKFFRIQKYIKNGDCYQINLAQRFESNYVGNEWEMFRCLNLYNHAPFSAFLRLMNGGTILSFSPERFLQLKQNIIQTRPIKGTLPRLSNLNEDLQQRTKLFNSLKNRSENLMIVDLMRNDIGRVAKPGSIQVPELFVVESFPTVHHLVSTITAELSSSYGPFSLLRASFPGGSITGAPKIRAMEIIDELEPHRRNAWCGSIGYVSLCGNMDTNIAIRTLIAYNNKLYCSAGGGIIFDSEIESEYQETFDKINFIFKTLKVKS